MGLVFPIKGTIFPELVDYCGIPLDTIFMLSPFYTELTSFYFLNYSKFEAHRVILLTALNVLFPDFFFHSVTFYVTLFQDKTIRLCR